MIIQLRTSVKIILIFTLLLLVTVSLVGTLLYRNNRAALLERELNILGIQSQQYHRNINANLQSFVDDVLFISSIPPVPGIIRTLKADGIDPVDGSSLQEWKNRLNSIFQDFLKTHSNYFQLRFIGIADNGKELVRVDRLQGEIVQINGDQLQQKGNRDYFQEAIKLRPGQVYLSEINLNREHGLISQPVTRTIRLATPVFDHETMQVFGIAIINVDIGPFLDEMEQLVEEPSQIYLVNKDDYFLIHPDKTRTFGFEYIDKYKLGQEMPEFSNIRSLLANSQHHENAVVVINDQSILIASNLKLVIKGTSDQDKYLLLILKVPKQSALADINKIRNHSILLTLVLLIAGILFILLFTRRLTRPLEAVTRAVENYETGVVRLESIENKTDELGTLARAFHIMTQRITRQNHDLVERERRLISVMESAADGIVIIDDKGMIDSVNPAVKTLLGYSAEELIGKNVSILMTSPDAETHDKHIQDYLAGGPAHVIGYGRDLVARHKDGSLVSMHISVGEFQIDEKRYFSGFLRDIRQQKRFEDQLIQNKQQLEDRVKQRTLELSEVNRKLQDELYRHKSTNEKLNLFGKIFENTREGIMVTDADENIVEVNTAFTRITGWERDEAIGQTPRITQSGEHNDIFYQDMWLQIVNNGYWNGEIWDKRKDGSIHPKWLSINSVTNEQGSITHYVGIFSDISELKDTEKKLERLAYHDPLTNLPNRSMLNALLQMKIGKAAREGNRVALLFIDLDRFKYVNDTLGHSMGDLLLKEISTRLKNCIRQADLVARQGGDEFVVVMEITEPDIAAKVADKIIQQVSEVVQLGKNKVYVGASIGIGIYPDDGVDIETLTKCADIAMYQAKDAGRNQYCFFENAMTISSNRRMELEHALRDAIENKEFFLLYQPKVDMLTGRMCGVEALVRWEHPGHGVISPDEFIRIAEDTGLIIPLGEWVMQTACIQANEWLSQFPDNPLRVSVNLSMRQFQSADLFDMVKTAITQSQLPPHLLELEITESMLISDVNKTVTVLNELRSLGLSISIDDFGTGYSSLSYLKRLPIQHLKIDRSFVRDIVHDADDAAIIRAIISLGNSLELNIVAEGVENENQLKHLKELACDEYQGYFFSKPVPAEIITQLLSD